MAVTITEMVSTEDYKAKPMNCEQCGKRIGDDPLHNRIFEVRDQYESDQQIKKTGSIYTASGERIKMPLKSLCENCFELLKLERDSQGYDTMGIDGEEEEDDNDNDNGGL